MNKKNRIPIPQHNKTKAFLQQEVNSECPFCENKDVGHFEIHHIDENPSNNDVTNLILLCPICHSKITKGDIKNESVIKVKQELKNKKSDIQFISLSIDSENCGWIAYENNPFAFQAIKLKSLFPIFNFTFINNSNKTILLTNISLSNKHLPIGLSGPYIPLPNILRPLIKYQTKLPADKKTVNTQLADEIEVPQGRAFKFQVEVFSEAMEAFSPPNKYALNFKFGFNNDNYIDIPMILLNSEEYYEKLKFIGLS
ncbi:hypothetical protein GGR22_000737 [Flavobacterium gossypii]|uniref:HNH nuclease domain-containing protein n=1 Tax=Flavobacterium gossypii TaxID=1646119 RepID=A0ABR6DLR4_9FLAO|nr:HNH endonuclease signature motif containing protein [Flavobacterium gossypii]MBA9072611.1 hypothetical protein [Flavobacterium gossypii]